MESQLKERSHIFTSVRKAFQLAGGGLVLMAVAGCAVKRSGYDVPEIPLPGRYRNVTSSAPHDANDSIRNSVVGAAGDASLVEWWRAFGNRELEELIDRGLANNPDVRIATLRLAQAKVRADQALAGTLPSISAPLMVGRGAVPLGTGVGASQQVLQGSLKSDWRVDLWGEQGALAESANLQAWRATFERDNVQRNMAAMLASSYIEYISLNDRMKVARETEAVLTATLASIEKRVEVGDATLAEFEQQRAAIFALRASIPNLEQQREDAVNAIAFLVGTVPGSLKLSDNGLDSLALPEVSAGLPSALLLRRPDVRMAEARLLAADADIDVARTRILPPVDLSAQAGYSSRVLAQLFQPKMLFWNSLVSLTGSIFDGGRRAGEKIYSESVREEMVETYVRTIYQAMREVEGALAAIRLAEKRLEAQREATVAAQRAWDSSSQVYAVGALDYPALLDTERTYHRYLDEYHRIRMDHYRGYINLFQALGGGVKQAEAVPGRGSRPASAAAAKINPAVGQAAPVRVVSAAGVDWGIEQTAAGAAWQVENFWQVELSGLYHRTTIRAAWRDLQTRFPHIMANRMLRPRLNGRIADSLDGQESWYRLYIAKFDSAPEAETFCAALQAEQQRCRVVSSRSDETVPQSGKVISTILGVEAAAGASAAPQVVGELLVNKSDPNPPAILHEPVSAASGGPVSEMKSANTAQPGSVSHVK